MLKLPRTTKESVLHVDASPDAKYPIRILWAYLRNTDCNWVVKGLPEADRRVYEMMNEHNRRRRIILERAIRILERAHAELEEVAN